jgi:Family of unknown function (DUF5686)/CarboxypepD_reg-like domain
MSCWKKIYLYSRPLIQSGLLLFLLLPSLSYAGGIRGFIKADDGTPLPYATIFVKQTGTGAATDLLGRYEVALTPGSYDVAFQYLGYETVIRKVEITTEFIDINIMLKIQVMVLQSVTVRAGKEDPAYTIMRKAIAKAKYHVQQIDFYTAKVYIKGKGKLTDYPWLAKKALEKEGITKDRLFISESVSEIKYTRPNKFEEKVIAVYTTGKDRNTSPNGYVFGSFYQPEIAETISPLSPKSFSYYRFEYLGSFKDQKYEISKIKVTPRSKGDNVFEGIIYIVEDWWSIHSLDFKTTKLGIDFKVKQIYNPIEEKAWLPISQQFNVDGKVFGFEFEYSYLATVKDYKIKLNSDLPEEMTVIDEKVAKEEAKVVKEKFSKKGQQLQERLAEGKEVTNKELRQLVKEYEKQEQKQEKEPEVISENSYKVDSLAYKKDSTFWTDIRPAPLDKEEVRGYKKNDSISEIQRKRDEGDSLKPSKSKGFQIWDVLIGDRYKINKTSDFQIHTPFGGFNTVEGVNLIYKVSYYKRWVKRDSTDLDKRPEVKRLEITPVVRYAFSRDVFSGYLRTDYRSKNTRLTLEGGKYIRQYNNQDPIHPIVNDITTLFLGDNLMKLYERDFVDLNYRQRVDEKYTIQTNLSWANRNELLNNSDYTFFKSNKDSYTLNAPVNNELLDTSFPANTALVGSIEIEARPWQKYRIRDGRKFRAENTSPLFTLNYRKGFNKMLGSDVDFDQLEIGVKHGFKIGIRGKLDVALNAGKFLNTNKLYFMDYRHFLGNRTPFVTTDPVGSFRLLDYYRYSTADQYFTASAHYHFRKFLVTRIPKVRLTGITENIFVDYLATPTSGNYTEVGYGIEGILRLFRLEAAASFQNGKYSDYGFRIGVATSLSVNFND